MKYLLIIILILIILIPTYLLLKPRPHPTEMIDCDKNPSKCPKGTYTETCGKKSCNYTTKYNSKDKIIDTQCKDFNKNCMGVSFKNVCKGTVSNSDGRLSCDTPP